MQKINLKSKSVDELLALRGDVQKALEARRGELQTQLARLNGSGGKRSGNPLKGKKAPIKYRGPGGETWSGRGAKPRWLVPLLKKGKKLEDFAVK